MQIVIKDKESLCKYFRLKEAKETWELNVCMTTTQPQKKNEIFAILQQHDGPWGYYAK